jgi:hypothetical protein
MGSRRCTAARMTGYRGRIRRRAIGMSHAGPTRQRRPHAQRQRTSTQPPVRSSDATTANPP